MDSEIGRDWLCVLIDRTQHRREDRDAQDHSALCWTLMTLLGLHPLADEERCGLPSSAVCSADVGDEQSLQQSLSTFSGISGISCAF